MSRSPGSPLGALLWVDEQYNGPPGLSTCFGDSYLVALNPVFAGVRHTATALGARFADEPGPLDDVYRVAPLTALDEILATGVVPYQGDVEVLRRLADDDAVGSQDAASLRGLFRGHVVMHESAHLIADRTLDPPRPDDRIAGDHTPAVAGLLAESLANAVETIGIVPVDHDTHEVFYDWNAQIRVPEPRRSVLRALARRHGMARLLEMALWVFFHFHLRADTDACAEAYRRACGAAVFGDDLDESERDVAVASVAATVTLNPKARAATTPAYCRLYGTADDLAALTALDIDDPDVLADLDLAQSVKSLTAVTRDWFAD